MSNHYHLLVETPDANLSKGMHQLNGVYTQRINKAHGRVSRTMKNIGDHFASAYATPGSARSLVRRESAAHLVG
jgi:REP element-mobilizing transposase RayT